METSSRAFSGGAPSLRAGALPLLPACGLVPTSSARFLFLYSHIQQAVPPPPPCQAQRPGVYLLQVLFAASLLRVP